MVAEQLELPPCINGTVSIVQEETKDNEVRTATVDLALAVTPGRGRQADRNRVGSFGLDGSIAQAAASSAFGMSADVNLELTASGSQDGRTQ